MQSQNSIEVLNTLITINNDRIEGYTTASGETEDQDLKNLFAQFVETSQKCKQELTTEVTRLGGDVEGGTFISGKFFRVWMDVKAALLSNDRNAIIDSCDTGEDVALDTYQRALSINLEDITDDQKMMITAQKVLIQADYDTLKAMRLL